VRTLTKMSNVNVDLTRTDRQTPSFLSVMIKMVGTLWTASFVAGITGDVWLAAVVMVGYPAAWSVAWLISK
jgi:hypothetical protein